MTQATIHQAKAHLSRLIQQALAGEEVIISKRNTPLVKLMPVHPVVKERTPGGWEGEVWAVEDFADYMPLLAPEWSQRYLIRTAHRRAGPR